MNELELIRRQLATERRHAHEVASACAAALGSAGGGGALQPLRQACFDYLLCVLAWFEERDQRLANLLELQHDPGGSASRALEAALAHRGRSREALARLETARATPAAERSAASWGEFAQFFEAVWSTRRDAIDALLAANPRVGDWRAVSGLDADTILEERTRYERVRAALPDGVRLDAAPGGT